MGEGLETNLGLHITPIPRSAVPKDEWRKEAGKKTGKANKGKKRKRPVPKDFRPREYKPKKFIAWDGEGISPDPDKWQNYVVFGHSEGDFIVGMDLGTVECLDFMVDTANEYRDAIHVIFGMDYDVNMILRSLPKNVLRTLHKEGEVYNWKGFHLEYIPHKTFKVWKHKSWGGKGKGRTLQLFDVFTFFSVSFVKALRQYEAIQESRIAEIESGKAHRGDFTYGEIADLIVPYWRSELEALVKLCEKLEESLSSAFIDLDSYHGPGAVADFLLTKYHAKHYMPGYIPEKELQYAFQSAYAGGRFEQFRIGRTEQRVYQYDIRSAYPAAIQNLPDLRNSHWVFRKGEPPAIQAYSLYKIRSYFSGELWSPGPFFFRSSAGNILYPFEKGAGWHYGSELIAALEHGATFDIEEYWSLEYDSDITPFRWVRDLYKQRANWKRAGNPAEKAAKLGINSLYGKFAQRVGGYSDAPKWHTLEWAGMVTADARSKLYRAMMQKPNSLIAVETDSVFSLEPLDLPISEELGDWEAKEFEEVTYLQSGVYFLNQRKSETKADKYRGLSPGALSYDRVERFLANPTKEGIPVTVHRFRTMGTSLIQYWKDWPGQWCQWRDIEKVVDPFSTKSKRIHISCDSCQRGRGYLNDMHLLQINPFVNCAGESAIHKLEWIDGEGVEGLDEDYAD